MQFEFPWALGPPDGRYVVREAPDGPPTHVLVLKTLGAPERRRLRDRRGRTATPQPDPALVTTARATVIEAEPAASAAEAERWLASADETTSAGALTQVAAAVRAHRLAAVDPAVHEPALAQALIVRAGYGAGQQVAEGRWTEARELPPVVPARRRRSIALQPQERLAALLGGQAHALACEELALRARHDIDHGQLREGALQLRTAIDAALAELPGRLTSPGLTARLETLAAARESVTVLADDALGGVLPPETSDVLTRALELLEAALRARAASDV